MTNRARTPTNQRALAVLARDAALARIGRVRTLMLVGAAGLTALLAIVASALLPGKSLGATRKKTVIPARRAPSSSHRSASAVAPRMPAPAGPAALGLQGPNQAPGATTPAPSPQPSAPAAQPAPAPAAPSGGGAVVSGGS